MKNKQFFNAVLVLSTTFIFGCQSPQFHSTGMDDQRIPSEQSNANCMLAIGRILQEGTGGLNAKTIEYFEKVKAIDYGIPANKVSRVHATLRQLGIKKGEYSVVTSFDEAIEKALKRILNDEPGSIDKGEKMAVFGKKLRAIYADNPNIETVRDLDFFLGNSVLDAEAYSLDEFTHMAANSFIMDRNSNLLHIDHTKYKEYYLGKKNNAAPFSTLNLSGGIISASEIRELEAYNRFPVYISHDITHVIYSVPHERYFPMLFGAARSKNHYRYTLIGALGEGVDTFQFGEESTIARFIDGKGLTLEEGMMMLARMTNSELKEFANSAGIESTISSKASGFANWAPKKSDTYTGLVDGKTLSEDGVIHFQKMRELHTDPDILPHFNEREPRPNYGGRQAR